MSNVSAVIFETREEAVQALEAIKKLTRDVDGVQLLDSAIVTKNADGDFDTQGALEASTRTGILGGALLGGILGTLFGGPIGGLVVGGIGGGIAGKATDLDIDTSFAVEVGDALHPGQSALIFMTRGENDIMAVRALEPYRGTLHSTTLSGENEATLRRMLE